MAAWPHILACLYAFRVSMAGWDTRNDARSRTRSVGPREPVGAALETSLLVRRALARFFTEYDLLICPTSPTVAWPLTMLGPTQIGGVDVPPRGHAVFTPLINHALAPAVSIPCGRGRDGLPVGLQIIGRRGADHLVLATAAAAESVLSDLNDYARC